MTLRAYADNVVLALEPEETVTAGGIHIPQDYAIRGKEDNAARAAKTRRKGSRYARVLFVGPGHYRQRRTPQAGTLQAHTTDGVFIPTDVKPGERVIIPASAGQDYALDLSIPRHNLPQEFVELLGERGEFRIVREDEIDCVVE